MKRILIMCKMLICKKNISGFGAKQNKAFVII